MERLFNLTFVFLYFTTDWNYIAFGGGSILLVRLKKTIAKLEKEQPSRCSL